MKWFDRVCAAITPEFERGYKWGGWIMFAFCLSIYVFVLR